MAEITSTGQQSIDNFLDECGEELEQVISDEETEEEISELGVSMDKNTNLHFSAARGIIDRLKEDLESPEQMIDAENFMGWTPLMMAVRNGHIEAVKFLLDKGADVTKKNKLGVNIFNMSIADGNLELMEIVLRHMLKGGISRNRIQENLSPISLAIIFKKTHLLRFLMSQGFDLNATTWKTGLTPLMFAAAVSAEKIIPVLEVKGANPKARNYMGVNYQEIIQWRRHGLENMRGVVKAKPKLTLTLPMISVKTVNDASQETPPADVVTTIPIVEKMASPIPSETNKTMHDKPAKTEDSGESVILPEPKVFLKQEVIARSSNVNNEEIHFNENDQNQINQIMANPNVQAKLRKDKRVVQPFLRDDSPIIQHAFNYQSPYSGLPCPLYFPVLNSPYGAPVPSPVTPMMIHPAPFQNFMAAIGDMAQNTPQSQFQFPPGQPVFLPGAVPRPDVNYAYDSSTHTPSPNGYQGSPFFYTVYPPPMPNVYPMAGPTP